MVDLDALSALDLLLWLGRGADVSERLNLNQSTVSRKASAAASAFGMSLKRNKEGWELLGDPQLVRLERVVHQLQRFITSQRLRLEADIWLGQSLLKQGLPSGWMPGRYHYLTHHQPLRLVRERILDGWLTILGHECRQGDTTDLVLIDLGVVPISLYVDQKHPLASQRGLRLNDLLRFPRVNLTSGVTPWFESEIRHRGLWDSPMMAHYYSPDDWEGRASSEAAIIYGHAMAQEVNPWLRPLDFELDLTMPISLVVHQDVASYTIVDSLVDLLKRRLAERQNQCAGLEVAA